MIPSAVGGDTATPNNLGLRLGIIQRHVAPGDFVLDVGCGRGEYLRALLRTTPHVFGIETAEDKLANCWTAHPELREHAFHANAELMPFASNYFDVVIVNEVLEHIPHQDAALREIHRVLKPGGRFILFCPNRIFPFETHGLMIRGVMRMWVPALHYLPEFLNKRLGVHPVARNYWPREVLRLLRLNGFDVKGRTFVQQTFENISGAQPVLIKKLTPLLKRIFRVCGVFPLLRAFVSASSLFISTPKEPAKRAIAA